MRTRRAVAPRPAPVEPFLKWVGGKRRLLPQILPMLDGVVGETARHIEPFAGGAAMFFHRRPREAILADLNANLVETYRAVRDEPEAVLDAFEWLEARHDVGSVYYATRDRMNRGEWRSSAERAAMFLYMNRAGFNGQYRVNARGEINTPEGRRGNTTTSIVDARRIYSASLALRGVAVECMGFESTAALARRGDFVYFDPPYVPVSATSSFTAYDSEGFGDIEQMILRDTFRELDRRGVFVMLSNSDVPVVRRLYSGFCVETVRALRSISADASGRGHVDEVVIRNW